MSNWNRLLASGLIIVLCCCLGNPRLRPPLLAHTPRDDAKVKVLVPTVDIEPYQRVQDSTKFKLMEFPTKETITNFDQIKDKFTRHYKLKANEPLYQTDFKSLDELQTVDDNKFQRPADVAHALLISWVDGKGTLRKGDRVDISATMLTSEQGHPANTFYVLEDIEVLYTGYASRKDDPGNTADKLRLLLRLTRPQSLTLKYFTDKAKIDVTKRKPGDQDRMPFGFAIHPDAEIHYFAPNTAQQQILNQWLGVWDVTYKQVHSANAPADKAGTAMESISRAIGGQFVQSTAVHSDQSVSRVTITFDVQKNCYRAWWFSSTGQTSESTGTWDKVQKTMTWVSTGNPDAVTTNEQRFTDKDIMVWNVVTKDRTGKQLFRMEGKSTRKKPVQKD